MCNFTTLKLYENVETATALYDFFKENLQGKLSAAITKAFSIQMKRF